MSVRYCNIISCEINRGTKDSRIVVFRYVFTWTIFVNSHSHYINVFLSLLQTYSRELNQQWKEALKKLGEPIPSRKLITVCMFHFNPDDIQFKATYWSLKPGTVPSIKPEMIGQL